MEDSKGIYEGGYREKAKSLNGWKTGEGTVNFDRKGL